MTRDDGLDRPVEGERPWTPRTPIMPSPCLDAGHVNREALLALPVTFPFDPVVPRAFGISRSSAYRALAAGQLPIAPIRLGRKLIVRRADLLAALGIDDVAAAQVRDRRGPADATPADPCADDSA